MMKDRMQKKQLNAFVANRFEKSMAGKSQELTDALKRYTRYSMQQYRTRYLLARLTQYVDMAFSGIKTAGTLEPFMKLEIEHILPNNPTPSLRANWVAENPNADYDDYKDRLGNLTLLEKPINIVASNYFYADKRDEYHKSGNYLTRSLVEFADVGRNTSISRINEKLKAFSLGMSVRSRNGTKCWLRWRVMFGRRRRWINDSVVSEEKTESIAIARKKHSGG